MRLNKEKLPFLLSPELALYILGLAEAESDKSSVIINLKDKNYSPEKGGFHPVQVRMEKEGKDSDNQTVWRLSYITDFCYVGSGYAAELVKDLDWDFDSGICQTRYEVLPIEQTKELFELWESNFMAYVLMGVFDVTISYD